MKTEETIAKDPETWRRTIRRMDVSLVNAPQVSVLSIFFFENSSHYLNHSQLVMLSIVFVFSHLSLFSPNN
ncbi:mCG23334, isoform CRA_a, partial [Mus musculus]